MNLQRFVKLSTAASFFLLTGCSVWSVHPVASGPEDPVDLNLLVGVWETSEVFDRQLESPLRIRVETVSPSELLLSPEGNSEMPGQRALLANVEGLLLVSIERTIEGQDPVWDIFSISFGSDPGELVVRGPNLDLLEQAMNDGTLDAHVPPMSLDLDDIEIRALPDELRQFFAARPEIFDTQLAILRKVEADE